jgi:hypothetical protein
MAASYRPPAAAHQRRRLRRALIAVFILAALGATGAGLAWIAGGTAPGVRARASHASGAPLATAALPPGGAAAIPSTDLAGLAWTDFYGVELPVSRTAGPRDVRGGLAWGFTDTPLGALLAAVNIGVRANAQWGPSVYRPTIRDQVTGPSAPALLAACAASYEQGRQTAGVPAGQPLGRAYVAEEAFRWVIYTPADATVDIVSAGPGDQGATVRAVTRIEAAWLAGDWRVIAPPGGDWGNSAAPLTSLTGYTSFPAPSG